MKIAFITDRIYPFYAGGYEFSIYIVSQGLSENNEVTIFTSMDENYRLIGKVKCYRISNKYKYTNSNGIHNIRDSIKFALHLLLNTKQLQHFDVIILNTIPYLYFGNILSKLKTEKISIFHEAWYDYLNNYNVLFKFLMIHEIGNIVRHSNAIIAISSSTEKSLITNYRAKNVYKIPNGIKIDNYEYKTAIKYDIIYLGRLSSIKHVENLISAFGKIKVKFPNISLAIAGAGEQKEYLINLSKELRLTKNISFLGYIDENDKYPLLRSSKIFVMPSEREGFSIATLEAMYCGVVPVIAKPEYDEIFGASDFVINNESGLYYPVGNVDELSNQILFLLRNEQIYNKLRINAMEIAKRFDWKYIIKMYNDVLNSTLNL